MTEPADEYLTPEELVARWKGSVSTGTLANWRSAGLGPIWTKTGSRIRYAMSDVHDWEAQQRHGTTKDSCPACRRPFREERRR